MVVSHKAKKKQHVHAFSSLCDYYKELFTQMPDLKFKKAVDQPLLQLLLSYYWPTISYQVKSTVEWMIKSAKPFLITRQPMSFDTHLHCYSQYSTCTCINTLLTSIPKISCYSGSFLRIYHLDTSPHSPTWSLTLHL